MIKGRVIIVNYILRDVSKTPTKAHYRLESMLI